LCGDLRHLVAQHPAIFCPPVVSRARRLVHCGVS
jgi:hypothetical protein